MINKGRDLYERAKECMLSEEIRIKKPHVYLKCNKVSEELITWFQINRGMRSIMCCKENSTKSFWFQIPFIFN